MKYIKLLSLGLLCLSVGSCQQDDWAVSESQTGFYISLADADVQTETRSTPQELGKPTTDNFTLKIVNSASGKSIYDAGYTKDIIKASAGVYDVTTSFGDNAVLAFDAPYYEGKKEDIAIEEGDTASVTVECAVANALASVTFEDSEKFKELYSSYAVEVAVENSSLRLEDGDKRSAYYRANSKPTFTFKGVLKANGKSVEAELEDKILSDPATFAAKAHCRLALALKEMVPGIIPTIVKTEVDTVTVSETLPMEWLPAPKVRATGFSENRTLDVYETAPTEASIDFTLSSPLQDIDFSVNFADENLKSLNGDYTLSALTNEQRLDFINAGIDIPIIGEDKPSVRFSKTLTGALLATNEGVVNNTFTLKSVKANDRTNADSALTYTIATHKPEFTVSVLPGNIWTKEFTVSALTEEQVEKGDFSKLSQNMTYQFSTDGSTDWTDLGEDLRKAELTPNTSYFVRGVYRNEICSAPVEVKTYPIIELENGDMEDWSYVDGPQADWPDKGPFWKRWYINQSMSDNQEGWCSLNGLTTSNNDAKAYISNSGTERSTDCYSGQYAAEIKTIGWGSGTTAASPISIIKNITSGELFLGRMDGITPVYGLSFKSRPTRLKFYYKFIPEGNHTFKVKLSLNNGDRTIAVNEFDGSSSDNYVEKILDFVYDSVYVAEEVMTLSIQFISGDNSKDEVDKARISRGSRHVGNKLYIDDISLIYDK
ncbi:DUF4493 domain-containing protein [Phocaeicola barnesiae]|uniref:DUF4493 domain-containing protein n=1 Tax=Phocaeicola barnesiae TaxID=376804 RepID=UPI00242FDF39|nr:DUF4493 domain-containing protein [Phocaeicola barnesiae]